MALSNMVVLVSISLSLIEFLKELMENPLIPEPENNIRAKAIASITRISIESSPFLFVFTFVRKNQLPRITVMVLNECRLLLAILTAICAPLEIFVSTVF